VKASSDHISGYDGANNVLHSIEKAGTLEPKAVVESLSKLDMPGYFGKYVFDQKTHTIKDGESFLPVPTAQIQDGNNVMVWPPSMAAGKYKKQPWLQD